MTQRTAERERTSSSAGTSRWSAISFDLRTIIGLLFTIYGLVCLVWGVAFDSAADSRRSGGIAVNLWAGIGMLVVAAAFFAWAVWRPLPVEDVDHADADEGRGRLAAAERR